MRKKKRKKNFTKSKIRKFIFKIKLIIAILELLQATATVVWFYQKFFRKQKNHKKNKN